MPICEHGHEHNLFVINEPHTCKGCVICEFIVAEAKGGKPIKAGGSDSEALANRNSQRVGEHSGTPVKSAPTNNDLLDSLIEIVEQHVSPEYGCRGCAEMGNPHYVHPKELKECREQMSQAMAKWVKEVFKN